MRSYLSTSQGRTKTRVTRNNICTGKLVLVGYAEDISKRGTYCLGRVHRVCRKGKELVRRANVAMLKDCRDGTNKTECILRDITKIAPVQFFIVFCLAFSIFVFGPALLPYFVL